MCKAPRIVLAVSNHMLSLLSMSISWCFLLSPWWQAPKGEGERQQGVRSAAVSPVIVAEADYLQFRRPPEIADSTSPRGALSGMLSNFLTSKADACSHKSELKQPIAGDEDAV